MRKIGAKEDVARRPPETKADGTRELYIPGGVTIKLTKDAPVRYLFEALALDFKQCSRVDLVRLASQAITVTLANRFRAAHNPTKDRPAALDPMKQADKWDRVWNVKSEFVDAARVAKDPVEKAEGALAGLTEEQLDALAEKYGFVRKE